MPYKNKEDQLECQKRHYNKHPERQKARVKKRRKQIVEWFKDYKKTLKCEKCGESDVACIDFHHKDEKTKRICCNKIRQHGWSQKTIKEEIAKCIVLCSNCHRKLHYSKFFK